jgi:hemoglobin-like flavoprotein
MAALAAALGDRWTDEAAEAWALAYNLTAETMMLGGLEGPGPDRAR